jgi:2-polyprenyl-3-methyl-5-hydroxy-6-metoxy-1,4-benzoquinol methylase
MAATLREKHDTLTQAIAQTYAIIRPSEREQGNERGRIVSLKGSYSYIPTSDCMISYITEYLFAIHDQLSSKKVLKICDFGCGTGVFISCIASYLRLMHPGIDVKVYGIEYDRGLKSCDYNLTVRNEDFFETPASVISQYDIIYAYNPLMEPSRNGELAQRIMRSMKSGSHFIFSYCCSTNKNLKELGFEYYPKDSYNIMVYRKP